MYCRICGDERGVWRSRSAMALCDYCHSRTPAKQGFHDFLRATFAKDNPEFGANRGDQEIAREFYADYKASKHGSAVEYWAACSSDGPGEMVDGGGRQKL